ncbi:uncharacterized protein PHACADRAFT_253538, partial [Phanerochaete carnosa HHB-10118-sp]
VTLSGILLKGIVADIGFRLFVAVYTPALVRAYPRRSSMRTFVNPQSLPSSSRALGSLSLPIFSRCSSLILPVPFLTVLVCKLVAAHGRRSHPSGEIAVYALEKMLGGFDRAGTIRRALISRASKTKMLEHSDVPTANYDYSRVMGACCENAVAYILSPPGIAGPLKIDGEMYPIPMAATEDTLAGSTSRGCKALNSGRGVTTIVTYDGRTLGSAINFPSIMQATAARAWIESSEGYDIVKEAFESTSRFDKLQSVKCAMANRTLYARFTTRTGDAMGMNMILKATEKALEVLGEEFLEMVVLALSSSPRSVGSRAVARASSPKSPFSARSSRLLKTTVEAPCSPNTKMNSVSSVMAGSVGRLDTHAANISTAAFYQSELCAERRELQLHDVYGTVSRAQTSPIFIAYPRSLQNEQRRRPTVSMPCIEVGSVGSGTVLAPRQVVPKSAHQANPGQSAQQLKP